MLFYITEEIAAEAEKNNSRVIEVLDFIARSHFYGCHIVFASRDVLKRLSEFKLFQDKRTAEVFKYILNRYSTFGAIKKVISLRVELILDHNFRVSYTENGRFSVIYYPITSRALEKLINGTELLGENVEELSMYDFISKYYLQMEKLQININYKKLHGGGDNLRSVWEEEAKQENLCLAFLDSDKKHPKGKYGDTLKKVKAIQDKEKYCTANFIFSDVYREIENMIPLNILKMVSQEDVNWLQGFKDIEKIVGAGKDIQYYDIKNGLTLKKYSNLKNKKEEKSYIDEQLSCLYSQHSDLNEWLKTLPENTILLHGLGENVLKRSVDYLERNFESWFKTNQLDSLLKQEWMKIGKEIVNWTCAASVIRI